MIITEICFFDVDWSIYGLVDECIFKKIARKLHLKFFTDSYVAYELVEMVQRKHGYLAIYQT